MGGRETVLVTSERQLFALVSKDRVRHCLRDGAEEARSQRPVLVWVEVQEGLGSSNGLLPGRV